MYLLEMPSEAANRYKQEGGLFRRPATGSWFLKVDAATLKLLSIPLPLSEIKLGGNDFKWGETVWGLGVAGGGVGGGGGGSGGGGGAWGRGGGAERHLFGGGDGVCASNSGLIFYSKGGGCVWVECGSAGRRDALVGVVSAWHSSETKGGAPLQVQRISAQRAAANVGGERGGRLMPSLLVQRKACLLW